MVWQGKMTSTGGAHRGGEKMSEQHPSQTLRTLPFAQPTRCRRYDGRVAVVTGAAQGLGRVIAKRLAEEGGEARRMRHSGGSARGRRPRVARGDRDAVPGGRGRSE